MENIIEEIMLLERELFDKARCCGISAVHGSGAFPALRPGLFRVWSRELLESYRGDLFTARLEERNLLCERHAYMMERTAPAEYARIKEKLPKPSMEKLWLTDLIGSASAGWLASLSARYPNLKRHWGFSCNVENAACLRGELLTYSVETLRLYGALVDRRQKEGVNLWAQALEYAAAQEGFSSLESAEARLKEAI